MIKDNDTSKLPNTLTSRLTMEQREEARQRKKVRCKKNNDNNNALILPTMMW